MMWLIRQKHLKTISKNIIRLILWASPLCPLGVLSGCSAPDPPAKFTDETWRQILDLQDRRKSDSLYHFLAESDMVYRRAAVLAFASIQDSMASDILAKILLADHDRDTRINAAYALGQTGGRRALSALSDAAEAEKDSLVLQTVLEALGKVGTPAFGIEIKSRGSTAWLCYRLGLHHTTPAGLNLIAGQYLAEGYDEMTRLGAAHFFARCLTNDIGNAGDLLRRAALHDPSAEVRMAAIWGMRKINNAKVLNTITTAALHDEDHRVRVNAIRSLGNFPFSLTREPLLSALIDSSVNVSIAAAEVIQSLIDAGDTTIVRQTMSSLQNWRVQAVLYKGINSVTKGDIVNEEIIAIYRSSPSQYQKAWLLDALTLSPRTTRFLNEELLTSSIPVIRTHAASALVAMNRSAAFPASMLDRFLKLYQAGIATGDKAVIGIYTDALMDSTLRFKDIITDTGFLYEARNGLSLPGDYESLLPLEDAIAYLEDRPSKRASKEFNHPVDWELFRAISPDQRAIIVTSKGTIVISLFPTEAPASVVNFVDLIRKGYYKSKVFHRVVPNFVVQGGCNRGDGWGSDDYSIRSEFSGRRFMTGSVGMASAGKDTEGTQWFITHSPAPHLDGRYTVFGEVIQGMEVVYRIEVGDSILAVELSPPVSSTESQ